MNLSTILCYFLAAFLLWRAWVCWREWKKKQITVDRLSCILRYLDDAERADVKVSIGMEEEISIPIGEKNVLVQPEDILLIRRGDEELTGVLLAIMHNTYSYDTTAEHDYVLLVHVGGDDILFFDVQDHVCRTEDGSAEIVHTKKPA